MEASPQSQKEIIKMTTPPRYEISGDIINEVRLSTGTDTESKIEVTKNTKGYNWTVSMGCPRGDEDNLVSRLSELNKVLLAKFGE